MPAVRRLSLPILVLALIGCSRGDAANTGGRDSTSAVTVEPGGARITLGAKDADKFTTSTAAVRAFQVNLLAPARIVAAIVAATDLPTPLVLFETQDASQLWSDFTKNRAAYARAELQRKRLGELATRDAVAGKDVVDAETDLRTAEASLRDTEAKLRQIGFDPQALLALPAGSLLAIGDIPEARIGAVQMGERATFDFNAFPGQSFSGKVTRIADAVDPQTRAIHVAITLDAQQGKLKPGMFARVSIEERTEQALLIPLTAVISVEARTFVFVRTGPATFERREVVLGLDNGKDVQVRSGVAAGDQVVTSNTILLKGLSFGY
ncbi:MAG: efflux RND transporter periplasmic adaptor subunit [Gemmatimonadetes bacterium]|nr:efflux RND transporter periplasmic adaptor subunit [Gemmatimonadota bacterium]